MKDRFTFSDRREFLFDGLIEAVEVFSMACCRRLYLNGSFVTSKFDPGDYDVAWNPNGVNTEVLNPEFSDISHPWANQKYKVRGEFLPTTTHK